MISYSFTEFFAIAPPAMLYVRVF